MIFSVSTADGDTCRQCTQQCEAARAPSCVVIRMPQCTEERTSGHSWAARHRMGMKLTCPSTVRARLSPRANSSSLNPSLLLAPVKWQPPSAAVTDAVGNRTYPFKVASSCPSQIHLFHASKALHASASRSTLSMQQHAPWRQAWASRACRSDHQSLTPKQLKCRISPAVQRVTTNDTPIDVGNNVGGTGRRHLLRHRTNIMWTAT